MWKSALERMVSRSAQDVIRGLQRRPRRGRSRHTRCYLLGPAPVAQPLCCGILPSYWPRTAYIHFGQLVVIHAAIRSWACKSRRPSIQIFRTHANDSAGTSTAHSLYSDSELWSKS